MVNHPSVGDVLEEPGRVAAYPTIFNVLVHYCRYQAVAICYLREVWTGLEKSPRGADDPLCGALADAPLSSEFRR